MEAWPSEKSTRQSRIREQEKGGERKGVGDEQDRTGGENSGDKNSGTRRRKEKRTKSPKHQRSSDLSEKQEKDQKNEKAHHH